MLYNMTMVKISVSKARERLSEVVEMSQSEPVELEHYGRRAAVLVSPNQYDEMLEALEESQDVAADDVSTYRIEFRPAALRELRKIDRSMQPRIQGAIALLAQDPRPPASRPLRGREGYRLRVGDYRIIYTIDNGVLLIVIVTIGHRRNVYQ
jgi:mRNA interferase RelE/StbE